MSNKVFKSSGLPIRRTVELLPDVFQSTANEKFLGATMDALTQPGALEKLSGYIGRKYGKAFNSKDIYLDKTNTLRDVYQLEPGVVISKNNKAVEFNDYIDFKNQLKFFGNNSERDDLITDSDTYSWNPPIDWDKFVNYREYFWQPVGPDSVGVAGQAREVTSSYRVRTDGLNEWVFFPDGLKKNPAITLYRGQTYEFDVNAPGDPFVIRTSNVLGEQSNYNKGVSNNGIEVGKITFTVPNDAPEQLFYQSDKNINRVGIFRIASVTSNSVLDVEKDILGKKNYTSSNGIVFSNGLRVRFIGNTTPEQYTQSSWFVEGVGESIKLISVEDTELPPISNPNPVVVFDNEGFDEQPFDESLAYPRTKDYVTINRASPDRNPWSRYNRWIHRSVIEYVAAKNNSQAKLDESLRAKRPIIEFKSGLQLVNHGSVAKQSVDLIDTFTSDVFSTIEGAGGYNVDGENLTDGFRIIFTADPDPLVQNKIFVVKFITTQLSENESNRRQISLIEADDTDSLPGEGLLVTRGRINGSKMFHFDGTTWTKSQEKLTVNQPPKFDVFDKDGVSYSDQERYNSTTFTGTEILSYINGASGPVDSELGFSLSYLNIDNSGDIQFEFDWDIDSFSYTTTRVETKAINTGYFKVNRTLNELSYQNGWIKSNLDFRQPIIQTVTIETDTREVISNACFWEAATREKVICYLNGYKIIPVASSLDDGNKTFLFDRMLVSGDVITFKVYTDAEPNNGYYEIPSALEKNPLNRNLSTFTLGQANDHLGSIVDLLDTFTGIFPGPSNLRDLVEYENLGSRFLKHGSLAPVAINLLCNKELNVIKSVRFAAQEYQIFKNNLLNLSVTLPFEDQDVVAFLDRIIDNISKSKNNSTPFSDSDMIGSGAYTKINYVVEDTGINTFALSEKFDLSSLSTRSVYVYINNVQQIVNRDYEFDSTFGFIRIKVDLFEDDTIEIREYFSTSFSFVPPTPTKMGIYKKFLPEIFIDTTYVTPKKVIRGHDGSITVAFNDFRDELLLEFEKRIYNNIKLEYNDKIFDIDNVVSSIYETGIFSKDVFESIINQDFLRWTANSDIKLYTNDFYVEGNPFTYTYVNILDVAENKPLPSYWRGIYNYLYDTDRPHLCPWEMLGFTEMPMWWEDEYGPAPYTSGNLLLWEDMRDGIIRQGDRAGTLSRYSRPNLLSILPVDDEGNLVEPLLSKSFKNYASSKINEDFKFGDIAPVEYSWRKSSQYPFTVVVALCLLRPFEFISKSLNRAEVETNIVGQIVNSKSSTFAKIEDLTNSLTESVTPSGLFYYIANFLKSNLKDVSVIVEKYSNLDIKLSNRIGGFVDKEQQKYLLDSKSPKSKTSSIFVPPEDYEIFFNVSSPVRTLTYSGIILEKQDRGWAVSGYDKLNTFFNYYNVLPTNFDSTIFVGGVSETFTNWESNQFYGKGLITKFSSKFYRALVNHTSAESFEADKWVSIPQVPLVGAIQALKRTVFDKLQVQRLPYGTLLETVQDVVDFIIGYGEYLKDQGLVFDEYSKDLQAVANWETSSKEFMFWTSHNWAPGALLSLSPAAIKLKVMTNGAVADNLLDSFYEYNVFKSDGTKLLPTNIDVFRTYNEFSLTPVDVRDGIYFARINFVFKEHVVIFNNRTIFNDVIYDQTPGYRQQRIKVSGFRTTDWDGDYTSPGFIFDTAEIKIWEPFTDYNLGDIVKYKEFNYVSKKFQPGTDVFDNTFWEKLDSTPTQGLLANFDYRISQISDFYDLDSSGLSSSQRSLARHFIGYQERSYLEDIAEDPVTQYQLYRGYIKEKGTLNSITKVFDKTSPVADDSIVVNEEWAFLLNQLGGTAQFNETEFKVNKEQFKLNPQPILLRGDPQNTELYRNYINLSSTNYEIGNIADDTMPVKNYPSNSWGAGYAVQGDVDFVIKNVEELIGNDPTQFKNGDLLWVTFANKGWDILRYKITNIFVIGVAAIDNTTASVVTGTPHKLSPGDIISLTNIRNLTGFFTVKAVSSNTVIISVPGFEDTPEIDQSSFCYIGKFESARLSNAELLADESIASLPLGSRVWLDESTSGTWEVLERNKQYIASSIVEYGVALPANTGKAVEFVASREQIIISNPGKLVQLSDTAREPAVTIYTQSREGLIPVQNLLPVPDIASDLTGSYGSVLATSSDGKWLMIASPTASNIPSGFKGQYNSSTKYNTGDTVIFAGKLWRAKVPVTSGPSSIDLSSDTWELETLHRAQPAAKNLIEANQGSRKMGCVDIYEFSQGQYNYRSTIISPRPAEDELFGSAIAIAKQQGIEGTSGDVTLIVKRIDSAGGIVEVDAVGASGLQDNIYQNISGTDISAPGADASFDVTKTGSLYVVTVRNGGARYAVGDQIRIPGSKLGTAATTPENDLLITVRAIDSNGSIIGSNTYLNQSGINSKPPVVEATFNISRVRSAYSVTVVNRGVGYTGRSIVSYAAPGFGLRYYGCIKDTFIDRGVWQSTRVYYPGEIVKFPANSSIHYKVKDGIESVTIVPPTNSEFWEVANAILPTNTEYWEEVSGTFFITVARPWTATVTNPADGNLGDFVRYTAGSTVLISGNQLGGSAPANNLLIRVNPNITRVTSGTNAASSSVTVSSVGNLTANTPIVFAGGVVGGISVGTQYYVKEVLNSTSFTIYSDPITKEIISLSSEPASSANPMNYTPNDIQNISIRGTGISGIQWTGVASGTAPFFDVTGTDVSSPGTGAVFTLNRVSGKYSASVNVKGSRYNVGDQIKILGPSIGGVEESYVMAISAPGAITNSGRVYLYKFDGINWIQLDANSFVGIFNPAASYITDTIVWFNNSYWKATTPYLGTLDSIEDDSPGWKKVNTVNTGILPLQPVYDSNNSSVDSGLISNNNVEKLNPDDVYGTSVDFTADASLLVVGAPNADANKFETYKGSWRSYQEYVAGDIVKFSGNYWELVVDATPSINEVPSATPEQWQQISADIRSDSGAVFIYSKDLSGQFTLIQTIDATSMIASDIESGDEFGHRVKFSKDGLNLFVSAPDFDIKGKDKGAVFVFKRTSTGFVLAQRLESFSSDSLERFGEEISVSPSGNTLSITAGAAITSVNASFDNGTTTFDFLTTRFREPTGITGKVYIYNRYVTNYVLTEVLEDDLSNQENFGKSLVCLDDRVIAGSPTFKSQDPAFIGAEIGRVRVFRKDPLIQSWTTVRKQEPVVDIDRLKSLMFIDPDKNIKLADIDVIDPINGKILSVAEQEIKFKISTDPAAYSNSNNSDNLQQQAWFDDMVGAIWWNTKSAKWLTYSQGDISFKTGNWNKLAFGASIDVYEWVESTLLPSEWASISLENEFSQGITGTPLYPNDTNYSVKEIVDVNTGLVSGRKYYYWVKDKKTIPEQSTSRKLSASSIANYIENPLSSGLTFAAFAEKDKLIVFNPQTGITSDNVSINIQFYTSQRSITNIHSEYQLLTEGVSTSVPTQELENKWIDSLIGYTIVGQTVPDVSLPEKYKYGILSRPQQSMFVDRNTAVQITLDYINTILKKKPFAETVNFANLESFDPMPSSVKNLYDLRIESVEELRFISRIKVKPAKLVANIVNNRIDTVDIVDPGYGYKVAPPVTILGSGTGAKVETTIDKLGRVVGVTVVNKGTKYISATAFVRQFAVLVEADSSANNYWSIYSLDEKTNEFYRSAIQTYDVRQYWKKVDWWESGFSDKSRITQEIPGLYAVDPLDLSVGELLRIKDYGAGNWAVLERVTPEESTILNKYRLVGRHQGTIEILNDFANSSEKSTGYDKTRAYDSQSYDSSSAKEFRIILNSVKNDIFIDDFKVEWNKLFFANIHYIFSEQLYVDWAFKTSFMSAIHNVGLLEQKSNYKNDNLSSFQQYIEEVKPYRTKVRKYTSRYQNLENTNTAFTDFDLPTKFNPLSGKLETVSVNSSEITSYPWKFWADNYTFSIVDILVSNKGTGYTTAPIVVFEGGGGTGAEARAFISNGQISQVILLNGGTGYTSAPTIILVGGVGTNLENAGKAVAIIGNSKARTLDISLKFDRYSRTPEFISRSLNEKFIETEQFIGTGSKTVFDLKYPSTLDKSKISVFVNGEKLLQNQYNISLHTVEINNLTVLRGRLTILVAPTKDSVIDIVYEKNDNVLDALNRIDKYYQPTSGMLGVEKTEIYEDGTTNVVEVKNDYSQLVTGIDYGGVIVQGATLDVSGGWDALPWFTEGWDSAEDLSSDFYIVVDGSARSFMLPYTPSLDQNITVYLKEVGSDTYVRIDYPSYDEYQDNSNIEDIPPTTALMNTIVGDGSTRTVIIPDSVILNEGDILIFRQDTSDGALTISDSNLIDAEVSGGDLTYSTATGLTAAEIIIDGEKFVSPDQVPAPEENIPGQVLDSVSIKVFHTDRSGAPAILSRVYQANGSTATFDIGQIIIESESVIVFVDKIRMIVETDYTIDISNNTIGLLTTPQAGQIIEVFSISIGGVGILDYRDFVGDGSNRFFLTAADFFETRRVFATVNGTVSPVSFANSNGFTNSNDKTLVEFGVVPPVGSTIIILVTSEDNELTNGLVRVNYQTEIVSSPTQRSFEIQNFVTSAGSATGSVIVDINGTLLKCVDTEVVNYTGSNNVIRVGVDPRVLPGNIVQPDVKVYINNQEIQFGIDYLFTGVTNTVTVNQSILSVDDVIRVEIYQDKDFEIVGNQLILDSDIDITEGDEVNIIWFDSYSSIDLVKDIRTGGRLNYPLQRAPIAVDYVWVYKNGNRLTPDVDFYIDSPRNTVYVREESTRTDIFEIISFSSEIYKQPFAYEIFKDILNVHHFTRYSITDVVLANDLQYFDTEMIVNDASNMPQPSIKLPGIVYINGERIEYLEKDGNVLKDLRRGTLGTSIAAVHAANTVVVDLGYNESVPYKENQERYDFVSDGSSHIYADLPFIPVRSQRDSWYRMTIPEEFGACDTIEVFVAGRRLRKDPVQLYDNELGSYSPAGDRTLEAEFAVDGESNAIRLTAAPVAGQRITVIRRTGKSWYNNGLASAASGSSLSKSTTSIAKFLQQRTTKLL